VVHKTDEDFGKLDGALDFFIAKMNLIYEKCHLNHGPGVEPPDAVNYLCQRLDNLNEPGYDSMDPSLLAIPEFKKNLDDLGESLRIPICSECEEALYDEHWLLFYCLKCNSSQWLIKSRAKKLYPHWESIRFLAGCPICTNKDDNE
jgi:hypothetical protein